MKALLVLLAALIFTAPSFAATCSPTGTCTACKTCKGCGNCAKRGGTCSVCRTGKSAAPAPSRAQRQSARNVTVPKQWTGKVVGIQDGDTITAMYNKTPVRIRLNGIDAPESKQPYGTAAKQYLSKLTFNKTVTIRSYGSDRYGRVLGQIDVSNIDVNASMVSAGYAWWYEKYSPKRTDLQRHQEAARAAKRGLWSQAAVAPWEWRKQKR